MTGTTNLNIRIDRDLKAQADDILGRMGMTLSTAVNVLSVKWFRSVLFLFRCS